MEHGEQTPKQPEINPILLGRLTDVLGSLTPKQLEALYSHDIANIINPITLAYQMARHRRPDLPSFDIQAILSNEIHLQIRLRELNALAKFISNLDLSTITGSARMSLRRTVFIRSLLPLLTTSIDFLEEPTTENYSQLRKRHIRLSTLTKSLGFKLPYKEDLIVNGPAAVCVFNFITNARNFTSNGEVDVHSEGQRITIENTCENPLPPELFKFGTKGRQGNTGIGLFIANTYADLEAAELTASSVPTPDQQFRVRFSLSHTDPEVIGRAF